MPNSLHLPSLGVFATFLLQTCVAFLVCVALDRLFLRPHSRCALWMAFVISTAGYWLFLLASILIPHAGSAPGMPSEAMVQRLPGLMNWSVPIEWIGRIDPLFRFLVWTYMVGVALSLARIVERRIRLRLLLRRGIPASGEIRRVLAPLSSKLGVARCHAMALPQLVSPATAYSWRPLILVPEFIELYLNESELRDVLCHELVHVKRHDFFWHSIIELAKSLLFFHPAVWLASQHLRMERELACDADVVQALGGKRLEYAQCLTKLARLKVVTAPSPSLALDFARPVSLLSVRVRTLLAPTPKRTLWGYAIRFGASAALIIAFASLSRGLSIAFSSPPVPYATSVAPRLAVRTESPVRRKAPRVLQKRVVLKPAPPEQNQPATPPPISAIAAPSLSSNTSFLQPATPQLPVLRQDATQSATVGLDRPLPEEPTHQRKKPRHHGSIPWGKIGVMAATAAITAAEIEASGGGGGGGGGEGGAETQH